MSNNLIYHYTTAQGLMGIIEKEVLWATNQKFLNDPNEAKYFSSIKEEVLENFLSDDSKVGRELKKLQDGNLFSLDYPNFSNKFDNIQDLKTEIDGRLDIFRVLDIDDDAFINRYIVSFCKNQDELPMWQYYAQGNGYSIGFDKTNLVKDKESELRSEILFFDIIYTKKTQFKSIERLIDLYILGESNEIGEIFNSYFPDERIKDYDEKGMIQNILSQLSLRFKNQAYSNEEEIRLVTEEWFSTLGISPDKLSYRTANSGQIIEYFPIPINISAIKTILLHPSMAKSQEEGLKLYLANKGLENVEIKRSEIPFRKM